MSEPRNLIRHISDGEPVSAAITNRAPIALENNLRRLQEIIDAAGVGRAIIDRDVAVNPALTVGTPVYYNRTSARYEAARAIVTVDPYTGAIYPAEQARVWGLVLRKIQADVADILVQGVAELNLSSVVTGDLAGRLLYLSGTSAGMLAVQQPPVSIPVALVGGRGSAENTWRVLVRTDLRDLLESHKHYRVDLRTLPAGDVIPPVYGGTHTIINPDPTLEGWLPANHAIFGGKAPAGAKFGYNITAAPWASLWPPIPVETCYVEWDFQETPTSYAAAVPVGIGRYVTINADGIWWLRDAFGEVPWPTDLDTLSQFSYSVSYDIDYDILPTIRLWFTRPVFTSEKASVLSLVAAENSGLRLTCQGSTTTASTGHLQIDLDLNLDSGVSNLGGFSVVKRLNGNKLDFGPVVEGIKAGTANVLVTGVPGQSVTDAQGYTAGKMTISVTDALAGAELPVETVHLAGAYDVFPFGVIGLAFDAGKTATIYIRLTAPTYPELPAGTKLKLRLLVLCRAAGSIPANVFTGTYRRIPRPSNLLTPVNLPTTDTALTFSTVVTSVAANQYVTMESSEFVVATGDIVMASITRNATDGYAGELDIIRKCGVLVAAE